MCAKKKSSNIQSIGVWGLGKTGLSILRYLATHHPQIPINIIDKNNQLTRCTAQNNPNSTAFDYSAITQFLHASTFVIPSPGINVTYYVSAYGNRFISELDFFQKYVQTPIIAITGSVGKTTITTLLSKICTYNNINHVVAGNIGTPLFDCISQAQHASYVIVECSSFQLELCKTFKPYMAVITNIVENHFDRHKTMKAYIKAKLRICANKPKHTLMPYTLKNHVQKLSKKNIAFFAHTFVCLGDYEVIYFVEKSVVKKRYKVNKMLRYQTLIKFDDFLIDTFNQNKLILISILNKLRIPLKTPPLCASLPHRNERVRNADNTAFINDSKSTTPSSTIAALELYKDKSIILIIGGLSKGINRKPFIKQLALYTNIIQICCFGKEAKQLAQWCIAYNLSAHYFSNLNKCMQYIKQSQLQSDIILFSPAGSSFDLYKNFEKRGAHFKKLVSNP